jgi:hypothetical protein
MPLRGTKKMLLFVDFAAAFCGCAESAHVHRDQEHVQEVTMATISKH